MVSEHLGKSLGDLINKDQIDNGEVFLYALQMVSRPTTVYCSSDATMIYLRWR